MALQELRSACKAKDASRVRELIATVDSEAATACLQCAWPDIDIMRMLLEHGADPSVCAKTFYLKKSIDIVKLLAGFGYDVKANGHLILQ